MRREEPLVVKLERQAGQKEVRFAHLLSGEVAITVNSLPQNNTADAPAENERIEKLEREVDNLREEFDLFRQSFEEFKKQFE